MSFWKSVPGWADWERGRLTRVWAGASGTPALSELRTNSREVHPSAGLMQSRVIVGQPSPPSPLSLNGRGAGGEGRGRLCISPGPSGVRALQQSFLWYTTGCPLVPARCLELPSTMSSARDLLAA